MVVVMDGWLGENQIASSRGRGAKPAPQAAKSSKHVRLHKEALLSVVVLSPTFYAQLNQSPSPLPPLLVQNSTAAVPEDHPDRHDRVCPRLLNAGSVWGGGCPENDKGAFGDRPRASGQWSLPLLRYYVLTGVGSGLGLDALIG